MLNFVLGIIHRFYDRVQMNLLFSFVEWPSQYLSIELIQHSFKMSWKNKKRPVKVAFLILSMEARGVEPLSEDNDT